MIWRYCFVLTRCFSIFYQIPSHDLLRFSTLPLVWDKWAIPGPSKQGLAEDPSSPLPSPQTRPLVRPFPSRLDHQLLGQKQGEIHWAMLIFPSLNRRSYDIEELNTFSVSQGLYKKNKFISSNKISSKISPSVTNCSKCENLNFNFDRRKWMKPQ